MDRTCQFIYLGAGSLGFQIGVEMVELILVVIGEQTMDSFLKASLPNSARTSPLLPGRMAPKQLLQRIFS